ILAKGSARETAGETRAPRLLAGHPERLAAIRDDRAGALLSRVREAAVRTQHEEEQASRPPPEGARAERGGGDATPRVVQGGELARDGVAPEYRQDDGPAVRDDVEGPLLGVADCGLRTHDSDAV